MAQRDDIRNLRDAARVMRGKIQSRPIHTRALPANATEIWLCIEGGQVLTGGLDGIKKGTTLATQTVWRDPYATSAFPDGLGRAYIWINGVQQLVRDAAKWLPNTAYSVSDKVRGNDETTSYICTVAGTSASSGRGPVGMGTGIVDGTVTWDYDGTVAWKPQQVLALLDSRAQWPYALAETEFSRSFAPVLIGNATNPSTAAAEDMYAYPLAFL